MSDYHGDTSGYITVKEASTSRGVSPETIRNWFDLGRLTGVRDSRGHRLIDPRSLEQATYLKVGETARRLGISVETVRARFDRGAIAGHRTEAGHRLIDPTRLPDNGAAS